MLPSFRLITATFCCGFLIVFAGLRLATTFNGINQAMPVMTAHAAPVTIAAIGDQGQRRGAAAVPVTYDLRFAVSAAQPTPAAVSPIVDRAAPLMMPLVILPLIAQEQAASQAGSEDKTETAAVAALPTKPAAEPAPAAVDIPLPEPVTVDLTFSPAPASAPAPAKPASEIGPKSEAAPAQQPETDARAGSASGRDSDPIAVAALAGTVELPITDIPLPAPKGVVNPAPSNPAAHSAAAKSKPRRQAAAKREDFDSFFHFGGGKAHQ